MKRDNSCAAGWCQADNVETITAPREVLKPILCPGVEQRNAVSSRSGSVLPDVLSVRLRLEYVNGSFFIEGRDEFALHGHFQRFRFAP